MNINKKKVIVGISGGIDSTVSAILLKEQGYDVTGIILKMWEYSMIPGSKKETGCCSLNSIIEARIIASKFGIETYVVDIKELFEEKIIKYFIEDYLKGRTPNPCVLCNLYIKWGALIAYANKLGADYIATGHYARIGRCNGRYFIKKAIDCKKDQSYMLWPLSQEMLSRTIFPLGELTKDEVRKIAISYGLHGLAKKPESYEICFVPNGNYRDFLKARCDGLPSEGNIVNVNGEVVGKHNGYWNFTIGQRRGLGVSLGYPAYVLEIRPHKNEIVVGPKSYLRKKRIGASFYNLQKYEKIEKFINVEIKVRYLQEAVKGIAYKKNGTLYADSEEGIEGVALGQSLVIYEGEDLIAGGIINTCE